MVPPVVTVSTLARLYVQENAMAGRKTTRTKPDFGKDVLNPVYQEAEQRVYAWLVGSGREVTDDRAEHTWHDFTIGHAWTLDVKTDTRAHSSGKVAWEQGLAFHNGTVRDGWGMHHGLNYVVYVLLPAEGDRDQPWPFLLCHAGRLRDFALSNRETEVSRGFVSYGTDRDGFGYVLDIQALREAGVVLQEGEC